MKLNSKLPITITNNASSEIFKLLKDCEDQPIGIKIGVTTKGCMGMKYIIEYLYEIDNSLDAFEYKCGDNNIVIAIEKRAVLYFLGSEMDHKITEFSSGFVFVNPNEKMRCGCGESFSI